MTLTQDTLCRAKLLFPFSHSLELHSFRRVQGQTCIIEPLFQQWLEFAHVLKAQIQGLKARDGSLAEIVSIQLPHGQANIPLEWERTRQRNMNNVNLLKNT